MSILAEEVDEWVSNAGKEAVSLVIVKEFMVQALDVNSLTQKMLKLELSQFFKAIRSCNSFKLHSKDEESIDLDNKV